MKIVVTGPCSKNKNIILLMLFWISMIIVGSISGCLGKSDDYYQNRHVISVNRTLSLHGQTKADIYALRKSKVEEHKITGIFPENYQPRDLVFGTIVDGADWVEPAQFYISNPYLLVLTSGPEHVTTLLSICSVSSVEYSYRRIDAKYANRSAAMWFYYVYDYYTESQGFVRLWFVNAYDAGFDYAHVDMGRSVNIDPTWYWGEDSVTRGIFTGCEIFHVGRYNKNNISPANIKARIKLLQRDVKTIIFVKLWKGKPKSVDQKEDFAYVITIEP